MVSVTMFPFSCTHHDSTSTNGVCHHVPFQLHAPRQYHYKWCLSPCSLSVARTTTVPVQMVSVTMFPFSCTHHDSTSTNGVCHHVPFQLHAPRQYHYKWCLSPCSLSVARTTTVALQMVSVTMFPFSCTHHESSI